MIEIKLTKVDKKGRIIIPKEIRNRMNIKEGDYLLIDDCLEQIKAFRIQPISIQKLGGVYV